MVSKRLTAMLTLSAAIVLTGCAASAAVPVRTELGPSLNEVRDDSDATVEEIMAEFPDAELVTDIPQALNVYGCVGEDVGIGHWMNAFYFSTTDIAVGIDSVRESLASIETSYGTSAQEIEYADGSTWPVPSHHLLLEDATGSYLLTFDGSGGSGTVMARVITACGDLR
ncbi:hypothetical protein [Microbacterium sp.]|uniref:hypothetical protein n=1 Tax=Microbacterium sp. TaxID=51671 RepID=UPI003F964267